MYKTLVEQFMEERGLPMSPKFKRQSTKEYIQWRQGKITNEEFVEESRCQKQH